MIGIIGYGFVGQALGSVLRTEYQIVDPAYGQGVSFSKLLTLNPKVIFLCLPTPSNEMGGDDSLVMHYVKMLRDYDGIVVVKSTVLPSTVDKILKVLPSAVVWPELLRAQNANDDMRAPSLVVLGTSRIEIYDELKKLIINDTSIDIKPDLIRHVTPHEASIFKYTTNTFLAMKVAYMHQMYLWLRSQGLQSSWDNVTDLLALEGRVGSSHLKVPGIDGFGFGGMCFPKDTFALSKEAKGHLSILDFVVEENEKLRTIREI